MKKFIIAVIVLLYSFIGVNMVFAAGDTWTQKADLTTIRDLAASFSIGSKGYIGTGYASTESKDFWEYDPATNVWTQKADFGGPARYGAVGFSIGSKGYIVLGSLGGNTLFLDFWEYNQSTNTWTQKADFGGGGRITAVAFSIGNKGYVGTGFLQNHTCAKDFWEYDPATDKWTQKTDFGGGNRSEAVGFSIGSKGYIGTGGELGGGWTYYKDFWEYEPDTDRWTRKADFGGVARNTAVGFSIGNKGYIGTGGDFGINGTIADGARGPYHYKDFWEYDPGTDTWTQRADFGGAARREAVGISIGNKGYIGAGMKADSISESMVKDFWEYEPTLADTTPDQFIFNDETGVALNTVITSNTITISGIDAPAPISITGGTYSINGGAYTNASGTVNNGDTVTVQQTSSGNYSTKTDAILTIGGVSDTFSVTTLPSSDDKRCFIATAAFGSPLAGQVKILRQFRDRYLLTNDLGRKFVVWYYRNGPAAASYIENKPLAKAIVQAALYPLIGFSFLLIYDYLPFVIVGLLLFALLYFKFRPKKSSAV